mgnify:CR=1 FL=1
MSLKFGIKWIDLDAGAHTLYLLFERSTHDN